MVTIYYQYGFELFVFEKVHYEDVADWEQIRHSEAYIELRIEKLYENGIIFG